MAGARLPKMLLERRMLIFALLFVAYTGYYIARKNYPFVLEALMAHRGLSQGQASLFGSVFELASGLSKFFGGAFVDARSPSVLLSASLAVAGLCNLFLMWTSIPLVMISLWGVHGVAQSFGWPSLVRLFFAWFPDPAQRGRLYAILSTSQNVGAAVVPPLILAFVPSLGWRAACLVPGVVAIAIAALLWTVLSDSPHGNDTVPSNSTSGTAQNAASLREALFDVVRDRNQWLIGIGYLLVSIHRNGVSDWSVIFLSEHHGLSGASAASCLFALEVGGLCGALAGGWASDAIFGGNRAPLMGGASLLTAIVTPLLVVEWSEPAWGWVLPGLFGVVGFLSFIPHMMAGLISRELAAPGIQSTAGGLTKFLGQLGGSFANAPLTIVLRSSGWVGAATCWSAAMVLATVCFVGVLRPEQEHKSKGTKQA